MIRIISLLIILFFVITAFAQKNPAYILFNTKGNKVSYEKMIRKLKQSDVILFGEFHDNPISHWLQLELITSLSEEHELTLGAEMIETDNQVFLDQYLAGEINEKELDSLARLWRNYHTDYAPLVDFAKEHDIRFIGTNVPRRFASMVYRNGFGVLDSLTDREKGWMATLPIAYDPQLPGYQKMLEMGGGHGGENLPKAQAIKDATMAEFIHKNIEDGKLFVHFNGSYHSDNYEGILWYLKRLDPDREYRTITTVMQEDVKRLEEEYEGRADFIICVPENMTRTY
ncbi:ChaN family lipoprotein [Membranihabitans maritimus]|uniref:ChaN family lipoprotein n=1 Tax=Membranihabitans maritimus TaxID=2904244 RepID=UPI001F1876D0|nr:ChaN family lipoprotein [Membranihabitans maritimus]